MHAEISTLVRAPLADVYEIAAAVEDWPRFLPHFRYVRVFDERRERRLVEIAARRDVVPLWWVAIQECHPDVPEIAYHHVRGVTRGLNVQWLFEMQPHGVRVTIRHDLASRWPLIGNPLAEHVVGPLFVDEISDHTLRLVKIVAEKRQEERRQHARSHAVLPGNAERIYGRAG